MDTDDILTTQTDRNVSMNYVVRDFSAHINFVTFVSYIFQIPQPKQRPRSKNVVQRE